VGFVKDTIEDEVARGAMFDDIGDLELEIPNYDVSFFIKYTRENRSSIFNAQKGKIMEVPDTDIRSVPDQDRLDENKFLRELKALYFKKEGYQSLAETTAQVSVGKTVKFKDKIWEVLEFEPVKQAVHLLKGNEIVKTALSTIQGFDQDNQLTWLHGGTNESFPHTLVKNGFCWKTGDDNQELCVVKEINGNLSIVYKCIDGSKHELPTIQLSPASDKLTSLLTKLPEMRRFRNDVMFRSKPMQIWTFRHLCTQSDAHRAVDNLDKMGVTKRFNEENKVFKTVDYDLRDKIKEFELAYNERAEVERNEEGFKIVPANI
jgi:hypothetical protein